MANCAHCNRPEEQVDSMVQLAGGPNICNQCAEEVNTHFKETEAQKAVSGKNKVTLYPAKIKSHLDEYVIGQDEPKKVLAVEVYNHYKRISNPQFEIKKSNILMIGDSGTGKTLLVQTLAKLLDLPMVIADMSLITAAGYIGQNVETIFEQLVIAADGDIEKAQRGIVMLDETDKIAKRNLTSSTDKDIGGEDVQQGLLKILEGSKVQVSAEVSAKVQKRGQIQMIDTTNILFICAGAFFGLDKVLQKNHQAESAGMGFTATVDKPDMSTKPVDEQDLIEYGFIPEFVGRLPVVVQLSKLTKDDYRRILTEPKDSVIQQYKHLLSIDDITLEFTDEFIDSTVESVFETKRGARALRTEVERKMRDIIYAINDDSFGKTIAV